ncbi:MAG: HAD-IB family hydrolase [Myxococcota bacterium]
MARAAFFDVDGTLTRTSLFSALGYYIRSQQNPLFSALRAAREAVRMPSLAIAEAMDRGTLMQQLFKGYAGMSEDRLFVLSDEVVDRVMLPAMYKGARTLVESCKKSDITPILISGSPDFVVVKLGERLGIPAGDCFGNRLEFLRNVATGNVIPPVLAGPAKAALIRQLATERGYDLNACFAYSDDMADAPMLSVVGHPAAVNPGPRLRIMAQSQRWPIIELN